MKKIIYLTLCILSLFTFSACSSDDNGITPNPIDTNIVNYRGYNLPLRNVIIEEIEEYADGIEYLVELSSNPLVYNGRNNGAYIYLELFQSNNLKFSGEYNTSNNNKNFRELNVIEFHVDPLLLNGIPVQGASKLEVYNDYFNSGKIIFNNYQSSLLYTYFEMVDRDGMRLIGNYDGVFDYIQKYGKINTKTKINRISGKRSDSRGKLREIRAERLKK